MPRPTGSSARNAPRSRGGGGGRAGSRESFLEALKALLTEQKPAVPEGGAENTAGDLGWRVRLEQQRPSAACEEAHSGRDLLLLGAAGPRESPARRCRDTGTEVQTQQQRTPLPPSWCPSLAQASHSCPRPALRGRLIKKPPGQEG